MYIMGVDPSKWHTSSKHAIGSLGANITADGIKVFRYVKLRNETATVAADSGDMVGYLASPDVATTPEESNTVVSDMTDAATKPIAAGMLLGDDDGNFDLDDVLVASIAGTLATSYYGWVQCQGYATVNQAIAGTTPADGDALYLSTTDKTLTLATAADDPICAYGVDVSAKIVRLACV